MKKLTIAQINLLKAAANGGGKASDAGSRVTAASLIKRGLLSQRSNKAGEASLIITKAGKAFAEAHDMQAPASEVVDHDRLHRVAEPAPATGPQGKLGVLVALLRQPDGATLAAMVAATGWQAHSVRGAMAGAIKKKLQLPVVSEKSGATRTWRIETRA